MDGFTSMMPIHRSSSPVMLRMLAHYSEMVLYVYVTVFLMCRRSRTQHIEEQRIQRSRSRYTISLLIELLRSRSANLHQNTVIQLYATCHTTAITVRRQYGCSPRHVFSVLNL